MMTIYVDFMVSSLIVMNLIIKIVLDLIEAFCSTRIFQIIYFTLIIYFLNLKALSKIYYHILLKLLPLIKLELHVLTIQFVILTFLHLLITLIFLYISQYIISFFMYFLNSLFLIIHKELNFLYLFFVFYWFLILFFEVMPQQKIKVVGRIEIK